MPSLNMSDKEVKKLPCVRGKQTDYYDEGHNNLVLLVGAATKTWYCRYRPRDAVKYTRYALGHFDPNSHEHMSVRQARDEATRIMAEKRDEGGADPAAIRAAKQAEAAAKAKQEKVKLVTVGEAVARFLELELPNCKNDKARYDYRYHYDANIVPGLGADTALASVTARQIDDLLYRKANEKKPDGTTKGVTANRMRDKINVFFRWASNPKGVRMTDDAERQPLIETNPAFSVEEPFVEHHDAEEKRHLNDAELRFLIRAIQRAKEMDAEFKIILQLMALTSRRPNELCGIEVANVFVKSDEPHIVFPKALMKGKKSKRYVMPLAPGALELVRCAIREWERNADYTGTPSKHLFRTHYRNERGDVPVSANALAHAMKRLIENMVAKGPDAEIIRSLKADRPTPYAFRHTAATGISKLGAHWEDRKAVMGQKVKDVMNDFYDANDRFDKKLETLAAWEDHVFGLDDDKKVESSSPVTYVAPHLRLVA